MELKYKVAAISDWKLKIWLQSKHPQSFLPQTNLNISKTDVLVIYFPLIKPPCCIQYENHTSISPLQLQQSVIKDTSVLTVHKFLTPLPPAPWRPHLHHLQPKPSLWRRLPWELTGMPSCHHCLKARTLWRPSLTETEGTWWSNPS